MADLVLEKVYALVYASARADVRDETRRDIFDKDSQARRLAVVGQIQFEGREQTDTVVLGPFHAQGLLTSREKFLAVLKKACVDAREAGQGLAWDPKSKVGRGRFMLVPAFMRPREAWEFYRPDEPDSRLLRVQESLARWEAGMWAREGAYAPVCHCGTRTERILSTSAGPVEPGPCPVHPKAGA